MHILYVTGQLTYTTAFVCAECEYKNITLEYLEKQVIISYSSFYQSKVLNSELKLKNILRKHNCMHPGSKDKHVQHNYTILFSTKLGYSDLKKLKLQSCKRSSGRPTYRLASVIFFHATHLNLQWYQN